MSKREKCVAFSVREGGRYDMKVGKQGEKTGRFVEKVGRYEVKTGMQEVKDGRCEVKTGKQEVKEGGFRKKVHYFFDPKGQHSKNPNFFFKTTRLSERKTLSLRLTKHNFPLSCRKSTSIQCELHGLFSYGSAQMIFDILQNPDTPPGSIGISAKSEISKFSNAIERFIQP